MRLRCVPRRNSIEALRESAYRSTLLSDRLGRKVPSVSERLKTAPERYGVSTGASVQLLRGKAQFAVSLALAGMRICARRRKGGSVMKLSKGVIIAIIAMVTVGLWFVIDHFAPGSPSWVVYIFGAAAIIGVAAWGNKGGSN